MATTIATLRARLRIDLTEASADRWADADLDRHIQHAVLDTNRTAPLEIQETGLTIASPASRDIDIASLTGLIEVIAVEYPVGGYPKRLRHFETWGTPLTLLTDDMPAAGAALYVYYTKAHTVDAAGSTLPAHIEDTVLLGAAGYAMLDYLAANENRVTIGGDRTVDQLRAFANDRLMQFRQELTALKRQQHRVVKTGELYTEDTR